MPATSPLPLRVRIAVAHGILRLPRRVLRRVAGDPIRSPEGYELDVQCQALLRLMRITREPELHEGTLAEARARLDESGPILDLRGFSSVATRDTRVPGPAGDVPVRVYTPLASPARRPLVVWFHGGGFAIGSIASHDGLCRGLAERAGAVVVSVAYRLAPENRFPAAAEDAVAVTRWIVEHAVSFGGDPERVAVAGDSAGGNLAAVAALACRKDATPPAFQLLVYPATDFTRSFPSHRFFADGFLLTERSIDWFLARYLGAADPRDPRASPLYATDVDGAPPALVLTAGFDPLRDEGRAYAERLRAAGVPVEHRCHEGMIHGFFSMAGVVDDARRAFDHATAALRRALVDPRRP